VYEYLQQASVDLIKNRWGRLDNIASCWASIRENSSSSSRVRCARRGTGLQGLGRKDWPFIAAEVETLQGSFAGARPVAR